MILVTGKVISISKSLNRLGINYIILRAGYGTTKDSRFDQYAKACQSVGIKIIGAYWFTYALNVAQAKNEAKLCMDICKPYNIQRIFYDFEYDTVKKAKAKGVNLGSKNAMILLLLSAIQLRLQV